MEVNLDIGETVVPRQPPSILKGQEELVRIQMDDVQQQNRVEQEEREEVCELVSCSLF